MEIKITVEKKSKDLQKIETKKVRKNFPYFLKKERAVLVVAMRLSVISMEKSVVRISGLLSRIKNVPLGPFRITDENLKK